jgi:hypothetical protein
MIDQGAIDTVSEDEVGLFLDELFATFNGLVVIDDIDTLTRDRRDTGEETLFLKAAISKKRTRILYTLRFPPTYALRNSITVPGLDYVSEFIPFVEACCAQFAVPPPSGDQFNTIYLASAGLPLIIETIVWIRKFSGNYADAISQYNDKGGDEVRRYLYQREYDRLEVGGKSQYVLSLLYLITDPVSFPTLVRLSNYTSDQIRSSLTECAGIFFDND